MPDRKEHSFGVVALHKKGRVCLYLLVQHVKGHWAFPKGRPQRGEAEKETARRELAEETGLRDVEILGGVSFTESYRFTRSGQRVEKSVKYFLAFVKEPDVQIGRDEIQDFRWVRYEEAQTLITFDEARDLLSQIEKYLEK